MRKARRRSSELDIWERLRYPSRNSKDILAKETRRRQGCYMFGAARIAVGFEPLISMPVGREVLDLGRFAVSLERGRA